MTPDIRFKPCTNRQVFPLPGEVAVEYNGKDSWSLNPLQTWDTEHCWFQQSVKVMTWVTFKLIRPHGFIQTKVIQYHHFSKELAIMIFIKTQKRLRSCFQSQWACAMLYKLENVNTP